MPHVLEFANDPRRVLREAERVLIGEGHLVIVGFNPFSWYGVGSLLLRWQGAVPWSGRFIALGRVKDWVQLLGFEVMRVERAVFRPPLAAANLGRRLEFLERLGAYLWPGMGAVYVLLARKRVEGLTPLRASWRQRRRLMAGGVVEPTVRTTGVPEE
jgi:SAM-dependent methyltransferase